MKKRPAKYWVYLIAIASSVFVIISGSFVASFVYLSPEEQFISEALFAKVVPFPLAGGFLLFFVISSLVKYLFHYYINPLKQLAEETTLISKVNFKHRVAPKGAKEIMELTDVINRSADEYQMLKQGLRDEISRSKVRLKEERNRLAALMADVPHGIIVCNLDGQIMLYNLHAQRILKGAQEGANVSPVGLGRSVFGVLERAPLVHSLEHIQHRINQTGKTHSSNFVMTYHGNLFLKVIMAPVMGQQEGQSVITGFVLNFDDITHQMQAETRRDILLETMTKGIRDSLLEIRGAISRILSEPDLTPEDLHHQRWTIDRASLAIQVKMEEAQTKYSKIIENRSQYEGIEAKDMMAVLQKSCPEGFVLELQPSEADNLWLRINCLTIVSAFYYLISRLRDNMGLGRVKMRVDRLGDNAIFTLSWDGKNVDTKLLDEWEEGPLLMGSHESPFALKHVMRQHGGEVLPLEKGSQTHMLQVRLPVDVSEQNLGMTQPHASRPVYYEFDLFKHNQKGGQMDTPLSQLTYVVFDTETTGLNPSQGDEIISIGAIRVLGRKILQDEIFEQLVDPKRPMSAKSIAIHGITPEMLEGQPTIFRVLPDFHKFCEGAVLLAHNAAFDMRFLQLKEKETGLAFDHPVLDTLLLSPLVHPNQDHHSLDAIAERLGIKVIGRHTALGDAMVTAEVFLKLVPLLEDKGIITLGDALQAARRTEFAKVKY